MAKHQQNTKLISTGNQGAIEQQIVMDDNLLPSADELAKIKEVDPNIITWILQRTEKEQDTRLSFNKERMRLAHREVGITIASLWLAFSIVVVIMLVAGLFIYLGKEIAGTVFGGVGIFLCVQSFLKFGRKK